MPKYHETGISVDCLVNGLLLFPGVLDHIAYITIYGILCPINFRVSGLPGISKRFLPGSKGQAFLLFIQVPSQKTKIDPAHIARVFQCKRHLSEKALPRSSHFANSMMMKNGISNGSFLSIPPGPTGGEPGF